MVRLLVVAVAIAAMVGSGCGDTYCGGSSGNWSCACGPLSENPMEFVSPDFCDLEPEERVCQAIARCGFQL